MNTAVKQSVVTLLLVSLSFFSVAENSQEGSLNTYNGENSTTNSHNNTEDKSVSNTYNGAGSSSEIPVGSAITPSYMSNGVETCLQGVGSSIQTGLVGISNGRYKTDEECNRRRDAKILSDLGMKVAAVARMCESLEVWRSMFVSGTPCPILSNGKLVVGKRAFLVMKTQPEIYIPDYNKNTSNWYNTLLRIGENEQQPETSSSEDTLSISDKFRSSLQ